MDGFLDDVKNNFLATGVGSLPYSEASGAVNFVFDSLSYHIPFWPQLPRRSFYENMYVQFSEKFPGIQINMTEKSIWVNTQSSAYLDELEECFTKCQAQDIDYFGIAPSYAQGLHLFRQRLMGARWQGWVKGQVIGPFSLGLSLLDEKKNPILYNAELSELLPLFLALKASWLIKQMQATKSTKIIVFIDEPYLVAFGTTQCSLSRKEVIDKINHVADGIHEAGALAGLHCCGNTDWDLVMNTNIDILNFDAYGYLDKLLLYDSAILSFLKKGRMFAMGIVPNNEDLLKEGLLDSLFQLLKKHPVFLRNGALITPSCGCSGLTQELGENAHRYCVDLAERLRQEF